MSKQNIHNRKNLKDFRQELRQNLTPAEAKLWTALKSRQLKGRRFNRQHSIGNYIVDFYCASEKLIVELDGDVHNNPAALENDKKRTVYFENLGYKVLRFENKMVFDTMTSVLRSITECFDNS